MIKLLHFADVHLGMENYGKTDPKTGINSRLLDFLKSFDCAVDYALKNKIDLVLFAGDAYKTRDPSPTYQREFSYRIKKLASFTPVVLLVGNHDLPQTLDKANTLDIYKTLEVKNVYVARNSQVLKLKIKDSQVQIATLPWLPKSILAAKEDYQTKSIDEIHEIMSHKLQNQVKDLASKIDPLQPAVLLAHSTVAGAEYGSEHKVFIGSDVVLPLDLFAQGPWDYVALGHLHKHQILSKNPPVVYSGSIDRVDFGEEKEEKGFVEVEIGDKNSKFRFIPVPARKFLTIKIKLSEEDQDPTQKVIDQIKQQDIKEAVVRVMIETPERLLQNLRENDVRKNLNSAYFIAGINKEVIQKTRSKEFEYTEELSVLEALEKYWKSKKVSQKRTIELKECAEKLVDKTACE